MAEIMSTITGVSVMITEALIGLVRESPFKNIIWVPAVPNIEAISKDDIAFLERGSALKNAPAIQKSKVASNTLKMTKAKGVIGSGVMSFAML